MSESQSSSHHTSSHHTSSHHGETSKTSEHSTTAIVTDHQHEHSSKPATKPVAVFTSKPSKTKSPHEHVSEQSEPDQKVTGKANKVTSKANKVTNKPTDAKNGHVTDDSRKTWTFSNLTEGPRDYLNSKSYILLKKVHSGRREWGCPPLYNLHN